MRERKGELITDSIQLDKMKPGERRGIHLADKIYAAHVQRQLSSQNSKNGRIFTPVNTHNLNYLDTAIPINL